MDQPVAHAIKRANNRQCFFRKQGPNYPVDDYPCFPDQEHSVCCREGDACMSNGLCRAPGDLKSSKIRYTRGSCTDATWQSGFCPQICEYTNPSGVAFISQCDEESWYCCDGDWTGANGGACCHWDPPFTAEVSNGYPVTTMPSGGIPWEPKSTSSTSRTSLSRSTSTASSDLTAMSSLGGPSSSGGEVGGGGHPTTPSLSNPTPPLETPQTSNNNTLPIALGAGIGGGIFAISCVLLGVWLARRRRPTQTAPAPTENIDGGDLYLTPQAWQSQPFVVDNKPPPYQGAWQPQPFPVVHPAELGSGRNY